MKTLSLLYVLICMLFLISCSREQAKTPPVTTSKPSSQSTDVAKAISIPEFDKEKAFQLLTKQTDFGPRDVASLNHEKCLEFLQNEMKKYADTVWLQPFSSIGYKNEILRMNNIFSSFNIGSKKRILLLAHWDSRPWADQDKDPKKRNKPILGANDGASGIAILMEVARQLKTFSPPIGVDILFVDGEDLGKESAPQNYLLGSKYFANNQPKNYSPLFAILLDMVGDNQLEIKKERFSLEYAPDIVELVWSTAYALGITQFSSSIENNLGSDDHIPLNEAGIKTIDIIDFSYPNSSMNYWHTSEDTPDKCSPESLAAVGRVLLQIIYTQTP